MKTKQLVLNDSCGAMRYASREVVERIQADLQARGVTTAKVYSMPMYGIEVDEDEWQIAKDANKARRNLMRANLHEKQK